jgi:hypothetical protein
MLFQSQGNQDVSGPSASSGILSDIIQAGHSLLCVTLWGWGHRIRSASSLTLQTSLRMTIEVLDFPETESYVDVSILDGGGMIGDSKIMHAEDVPHEVPMSCWVFYISHEKSGKKVIWDVGISAVLSSLFAGIDVLGSK